MTVGNWIVVKNDRFKRNPNEAIPECVVNVTTEKEFYEFNKFLLDSGMQAYGNGYKKCFKGRIEKVQQISVKTFMENKK